MTDGGELYMESGIGEDVRKQLRNLGHKVATSTIDYGGYQGILWNEEQGVYHGASESRKDGQAAGY